MSLPFIIPGAFTVAGLPPAAEYPRMLAWTTDGTVGGCFMVSNGTAWYPTESIPSIGPPVARTLALGAAYQATDPTKPAFVTLNLLATSQNSLLNSAQAIQRGEVYLAATSAGVTGATGTKIGGYRNGQGGVLVIGLTITQELDRQITVPLPLGWWFGARQTVGANLTIDSAFDQTLS